MGATNSALAGLPVPDTAAPNDVPYWLSQLVAVLDTQVLLTATTTSDRDSKFFNAPSGVVCVVRGNDGTVVGVYVKTSDPGTSTWSTLWTAPVAPTPVDIPLADGIQVTNGKPPIAVFNAAANTWTLWGNVAFTNGSNIPNGTVLGTLPAAVQLSTIQPVYEGNAPTSVAGTNAPSGAAKISVAASGSITIFLGTGVQPVWVGFDGIVIPAA